MGARSRLELICEFEFEFEDCEFVDTEFGVPPPPIAADAADVSTAAGGGAIARELNALLPAAFGDTAPADGAAPAAAAAAADDDDDPSAVICKPTMPCNGIGSGTGTCAYGGDTIR